MRRTGSASSCPALLCPLVPLFHFCVWVTVWVKPLTHILTRTVSLLFATKNPRKPKFSGIFGAATQIRTGDLILTKRPQNFFLTIFVALWPYPLQTACFPSLFENMVSTCSAALCGKLCGQTVVAVGLAIWRFAQMWSECGFLRRRSNAPAWFWQVTTELLLRWC